MTEYEQALQVLTQERKVSITLLQRRLCISYLVAGQMIDRMKTDGYISDDNKVGIYYVLQEK